MMKLLLLATLLALSFARDAWISKNKDGSWTVNEGLEDAGAAWARYNDEMETAGWGKLFISTTADAPDEDQMYGAGYLEGFLTQRRIYETYMNYRETSLAEFPAKYPKDQWPQPVVTYMTDNEKYTRNTAEAQKASDPYWMNIYYHLRQFDGLVAGYNAACNDTTQRLQNFDFWVLNAMGDMDDLGIALFLDDADHVAKMHDQAELHSHCTGLIKLVKNAKGFVEDIMISQDAWSGYSTMNRMLKSYEWKLQNPAVLTHKAIMSSYPGVLFSNDDFYVTDTQLAIIETTFHCWDNELYRRYITPRSVLTWVRAMVATRMSSTGKQWADTFRKENSGTYNNQYYVADHKLFDTGMKPKAGFLWGVEQMPGLMMDLDRTPLLLEEGFVPSINVPSIVEVYNYAKYPEKVANTSNYWSYNDSARMHIIKRDHAKIVDYEGFKNFMRYNNYQKDAESLGDPAQTICSRYDLRTSPPAKSGPSPFGGTDSKTASHFMITKMKLDAIAGPTTHPDLPAWTFSGWEKDHAAIPHRGIPDGPWPKPWQTFAFDDMGLGHRMSIWAILGSIASGLFFLAISSWMGWSCKRKGSMPAFNKTLQAAAATASPYEALPSSDPLAAPVGGAAPKAQ